MLLLVLHGLSRSGNVDFDNEEKSGISTGLPYLLASVAPYKALARPDSVISEVLVIPTRPSLFHTLIVIENLCADFNCSL